MRIIDAEHCGKRWRDGWCWQRVMQMQMSPNITRVDVGLRFQQRFDNSGVPAQARQVKRGAATTMTKKSTKKRKVGVNDVLWGSRVLHAEGALLIS